jgi:hypothetical protein
VGIPAAHHGRQIEAGLLLRQGAILPTWALRFLSRRQFARELNSSAKKPIRKLDERMRCRGFGCGTGASSGGVNAGSALKNGVQRLREAMPERLWASTHLVITSCPAPAAP